METALLSDLDQSDFELFEAIASSLEPPRLLAGTPASPPQRSEAPPSPAERSVAPAPAPQRAVARTRPPRPRKPTLASLRAQVEAFQFVVDNLPYVLRDLEDTSPSTLTTGSTGGEDDPTDAEDHDTKRIRSFLKRTVLLTKEAQEELAKRSEYLRMLKRHYESTANLHKLMRGLRLDDWFWMCDRWREVTRQYYQPLAAVQCYAIMQETIRAIEAHKLPHGTKENGTFGWCDSVHLDDDQRYVRFMTRKTLNTDMHQLVDHAWSLYQDGELLKKAHFTDNCKLFLQVLQRFSPDVMIIQRVEQYPDVQLTHAISLIFRMETETGYMIVLRCIDSPQLQSLMKAGGLSLCGSFHWETFDAVHRDAQGECDEVQFTVAGSIGSDNPKYARRWRDEILIALVRYETQYLDTPILSIESVTEEDNTPSQATV